MQTLPDAKLLLFLETRSLSWYILNAYITCSMHINKIQHNDTIHMTIRGFIKNVPVFEHLDCIVL